MLDSIYVAMTGLLAFSKGLRNIGNNTANLNTPGFKASQLQFTDLFSQQGMQSGTERGGLPMTAGHGVNALSTALNFSQGELRQTGNALDLAIDGAGLFTVREGDGSVRYTRAGQFEFNAQGQLAERNTGALIMAHGAHGQMEPLSLDGHRLHPGTQTRNVVLRGNLISNGTSASLSDLSVVDRAGNARTLTLTFVSEAATSPGQWTAILLDGETEIGRNTVRFVDGRPDPATAELAFGLDGEPLTITLGDDVSSFSSGTESTLAVASQDGVPPGQLTRVEFDARGALQLFYSNGEKAEGARLALARFDAPAHAIGLGGTSFRIAEANGWHFGVGSEGGFGAVRAGRLEMSNVDMTSEFSQLVVLQRGYQGSSSVVTSANEMMQQLFGIVGNKS